MIRWAGGFESRHRIMKPVQKFEWLESASEIGKLIERRKHEGKTHAEVSEELNREGYHPTNSQSYAQFENNSRRLGNRPGGTLRCHWFG